MALAGYKWSVVLPRRFQIKSADIVNSNLRDLNIL